MPLTPPADAVGLETPLTRGSELLLAEAITRRISQPRYDLWFRSHTTFVFLGDRLVVGVPNLHFHDWLQKTFGDDVRAAAAEVFGGPVTVQFAIDPDLFRALRQEQAAAEAKPAPTIPAKPALAVKPTASEPVLASLVEEKVAEFRKPKRRWKLPPFPNVKR